MNTWTAHKHCESQDRMHVCVSVCVLRGGVGWWMYFEVLPHPSSDVFLLFIWCRCSWSTSRLTPSKRSVALILSLLRHVEVCAQRAEFELTDAAKILLNLHFTHINPPTLFLCGKIVVSSLQEQGLVFLSARFKVFKLFVKHLHMLKRCSFCGVLVQ